MSGPSNRQLADKFQRASGADVTGEQPAVAPAEERLSKFTVILSARDAADFDALVLTARRALGRRVDKSEVVRALIGLMSNDAALRAEVHELLSGRAR